MTECCSTLTGSDTVIQFSCGTHVVLNVEGQENVVPRERDSSRVHTHVLSEYKWASEECYNGHILAVHDNFIAYRLFNESAGEAVRILERTTSKRHLIKVSQFVVAKYPGNCTFHYY